LKWGKGQEPALLAFSAIIQAARGCGTRARISAVNRSLTCLGYSIGYP
jgi:hypothetical protein